MTDHRNRLDRAIEFLAMHHRLLAALFISLNAWYTLSFYRRIAYADQLDLLPLFKSFVEGGEWWREIFERHGSHWHAGGYALMLPLARASEWDLRWEALLSLVLLVLSWWLLIRMVRTTSGGSAVSVVALLTTLFLFSLIHSANLLWTWQLSVFISLAGTCLAIYALTSVQRSAWFLAAALIATIISVSSFATGFAIWPVGVIMIAANPDLRPARKTAFLVSWLLSGGIVMWLYVSSEGAMRIAWADIEPLFVFGFVLTYLGAPLGYFSGRLAPLFGLIGIISAVLLTLRIGKLDSGVLARLRPVYGLMLFAVGCAALSALGRADFGLDQARSPRYLIFSQLYWVGLFALAGSVAGMTSRLDVVNRFGLRRFLNIAAALAIALTLYNSQKIAKRQAIDAMRLNDAAAEIRDRYPNVPPGTYQLLDYPDHRRAEELLAIMHQYRINLFDK